MLGKRLINTTVAGAAPSCTTDTLQILGDTSCIAYYKMSDATDESGNYDGTPTDVNFNVAGKFGNAGDFNGSNSIITLANTPSLSQANNFTWSYWVKPNGFTANGTVLRLTSHSYTSHEIRSNGIIFFYWGNAGSLTTSSGVITDGVWQHVAITKSSTSGVVIYVDGVSVATSSNTANADSTNATNRIGGWDGTNFGFTGSIDQVRIFNKALTSTEVTTLYNEVYCVPTIVPTDNFEPVIYTGNGTTQSITGTNFTPDLVWAKSRTSANFHYITDRVRGVNKVIYSNATNAEDADPNGLSSFNSNGFTVGASGGWNGANNYVAWNWKAGGADVLNQEGTIDSQVSANVDAGFSIVKYQANSTQGATIGHGLDNPPEMIITKEFTGPRVWCVYHKDLTNSGYYLELNTTDAQKNSLNTAYAGVPTSSTYSVGNSSVTNDPSTDSYIAYCFHSVDGYSKIGSYVGGGTTDVPITLGFRPAFVMIKSSTYSPSGWIMYDNKRQTGTGAYENYSVLFANTSQVEATNNVVRGIQFNSNGFIANQNYEHTNDSGDTYIFLAIAEEVFNPNGVTRNATNPFGDASELALYKFEDNANDAEGSYNGTATNVTYATGYIDKAAVFNGSSSKIVFPSILSGITNVFSYSCWFKITDLTIPFSTLDDGSNQNTNVINYIPRHSNGNYYITFGAESNRLIGTSPSSYSDGGWHHMVVTKSSSSLKFYSDGVLLHEDTSHTDSVSGLSNAQIAHYSSTFSKGSIDQVRIFNRVLDSGEITQLYNE